MTHTLHLGLAALLLWPLWGTAQDKITIKPSRDTQGDISHITREEKNEEVLRLLAPDGKEIQKKNETVIVTAIFCEEILAKPAGQRSTKLARVYEKAEIKNGAKTTPFAYAGKTVLIEQVGPSFKFTVDGKPLAGKDLGTLARDFDAKRPSELDSEKIFLPTMPVAVGESWSVDAKAVLLALTTKEQAPKSYDLAKAKASGKLAKVYKSGGALFGIIDFELTAPLKEFGPGIICKEGATMTLQMRVDACIDGTVNGGESTTRRVVRGKADIMKDNQPTGATLEFDITSTVTSSGTPGKK